MATSYSPRAVTDGLVRCVDVGNIKSYPETGTTLFDLTGTFNNTINTGTHGTYDRVKSLDFDGTYGSSRFISAGTTGIVNTSFSVDVWCRSTDTDRANGTEGRVIASTYQYQGSPSLQDTGWFLGTVWIGTYFWFAVCDGLGGSAIAQLPSGFYTNYLNKWTNLVGVFSSGNFVKIYQDGVLRQTTNTAITTLNSQDDALVWCRRSANAQSNWKGQFASGKYYNRVLTDSEILQNYNATRSRFGI